MGDFREKANHFNKYFPSICTPIDSSCLPISIDLINPSACFSTFNFADDEILKIIRALDINKAHGHDEISVRMIKICDDAIIEPLSLIYKTALRMELFQKYGKNQISFLSIKKEKNTLLITIDLFHYYPYLVKYLKEFYLTHYLIIFKKIISFVNISLAFDQMIHVYINYFQLYMIFMLLLIVIHHSMLEAYFWICLKHLTKFGMMDLFTR